MAHAALNRLTSDDLLAGLHERGASDVLDEGETAHAKRPGQHGDEPAELVAKKVLHQCARFAHA